MPHLELLTDPVALTVALVDIPSPSHKEKEIADSIEYALRQLVGSDDSNSIEVIRQGNTVAARTNRGLASRVLLAGHVDTVPVAENLPHQLVDGILYGCGTVDMKSGLAVYLHCFAALALSPQLTHDLTVIAYECEEVDSRFNGLGHLVESHPDWVAADLALLGEPSGAIIEAGCQGSVRVKVTGHGVRAHSARGWLGDNAAHKLGEVISRVARYQAREVNIDGLIFKEGINVVRLASFVANNIIPDEASMLVNYRFAPDINGEEALKHLKDVLKVDEGFDVTIEDVLQPAMPGLEHPSAVSFVDAVGGEVRAKFGWTDVSRFAELGIPALNFGPGDPSFAHRKDEQVPIEDIYHVQSQLHDFLVAGSR